MSRRVVGAIALLWIAQAAGCKQCATCSDFPASCSGPGCVGSSNYPLRTGFTAPSDAVTKTGGSNEGSTTGLKNATAGSATDANAAGTAATSNTNEGVKNDASPTPPPEDLKSPLSPIDPPK